MSAELEDRLTKLEVWKSSVDLRVAGASITAEYMEKRFNALDARLDKYDAHISKFIWIIISGAMAVGLAFVFKGGLMQ